MSHATASALLRQVRGLVAARAADAAPDADLLERFRGGGDAAAFEALVRRHGPMVLRVCRRVLGDVHDAEDAFQATFLVLAQKAGAIRKGASVASWLHGVAYRVAGKARARAARSRPTCGAPAAQGDAADEVSWREVRSVLDAELGRLPEECRAPLVLCYLEGLTQDEAARRLGWSGRTLRRRLGQGRRLLRARLARRGLALSAGLGAVLLTEATAPAALPSALAEAAVKAAKGTLPTHVMALARGAAGAGCGKAKLAAGLLLAAGVFAGAGVAARQLLAAKPSVEERAEAPPAAPDRPAREEDRRAGRDRYGDPLPAEALARLGTVRFRHAERITSLAFTPDGKRLVSHGGDGIRAWDAATGREVGTALRESAGWTEGGVLTCDGKTVVGLEHSPNHFRARVRSASDLKPLREFAIDRPYLLFRVSPDGKYLAGARHDQDRTIDLWDIASGKQIRSWDAHDRRIWTLQFSADGKTLVTCGEDKAVRFWDVATGKQGRAITGYPDVVGVVALSPDGSRLATVGMTESSPGVGSWPRASRVRLWDVAAGREIAQLTVPPKGSYYVADMAFAADGKALVTSGPDDKVHFWGAADGKELRRLDVGELPGAIALSPKGDALAVAVGDKTIRLIDVAAGKDAVSFSGHQRGLLALAITPGGRTVVTADGHSAIRLWGPTTGRERGRLEVGEGPGWVLRLLGDGTSLLSRDADGALRVWDLATGRERRRFNVPLAGRAFFDVSPDGKTVAGAVSEGDREYAVALVELATGRVSHKLRGPWPCGGAFTPDGRTLVAWYFDRTARVWDAVGGRKLREVRLEHAAEPRPAGRGSFAPYPAALSPDGRLLAHANPDNQTPPYLALHELATGKAVRVLDQLPDRVSALAFSPDGRALAWGGRNDRSVHLVEVATGRERHIFRGHKGAFTALAFAPDGRLLVSGNEDTTALVWDLTGRLGAAGKPSGPEGLVAAWAGLAGDDAAAAYDALRRLAAAPADAVPLLRKLLRPVPVADEKRLARLVADLDSDEYAVREKASGALKQMGEAAVPACRKALAGRPSAEMRQRLEKVLEREERGQWSPSGERLRQLRALEALELAGSDEARRLLEELAGGMPGAWLTEEAKAALKRLGKASRP
jgi:RNA polymerase sigma factor (sigma-70 family)